MRKIILRKVGTNYVTTIPSEVVKALRLKPGQKFQVSAEGGRLILTPMSPTLDEVMKAHGKVLRKYRSAFQKLADT